MTVTNIDINRNINKYENILLQSYPVCLIQMVFNIEKIIQTGIDYFFGRFLQITTYAKQQNYHRLLILFEKPDDFYLFSVFRGQLITCTCYTEKQQTFVIASKYRQMAQLSLGKNMVVIYLFVHRCNQKQKNDVTYQVVHTLISMFLDL